MSEHDVPDGVEFVQHEPCDNCGSSDAAARYSDDHLYCFSCHTTRPRNIIRRTMKSQPTRWRTRAKPSGKLYSRAKSKRFQREE